MSAAEATSRFRPTPGHPGRRNVFLLAVAQALFMSVAVIGFSYAGLGGEYLTGSRAMATVPVGIIGIGSLIATMPASLLMKRIGRKRGFYLGALAGVLAGLFGMAGLAWQDFILFCVAMFFLGVYQAVAQYYRFGAVESSEPAFVSRAVSYVLAGGVVAAIAGPQISIYARALLPAVPYFGAYAAIVGLSVLAFLPLWLFRNPEAINESDLTAGRPLKEISKTPVFVAAVINAAAGYALMVLVMTSTPLVMVDHGHTTNQTAIVIQWHVLAMFVPSFFTGTLIARIGLIPVLGAGMALFAVAAVVALMGAGLAEFTTSMVLVGIGWNFMFVGGTTLLTESYRSVEKAKVQAVNEFMVFGVTTVTSFSSGALLAWFGWDAVNYGVLPILVIVSVVTVWYGIGRRRAAGAELAE